MKFQPSKNSSKITKNSWKIRPNVNQMWIVHANRKHRSPAPKNQPVANHHDNSKHQCTYFFATFGCWNFCICTLFFVSITHSLHNLYMLVTWLHSNFFILYFYALKNFIPPTKTFPQKSFPQIIRTISHRQLFSSRFRPIIACTKFHQNFPPFFRTHQKFIL